MTYRVPACLLTEDVEDLFEHLLVEFDLKTISPAWIDQVVQSRIPELAGVDPKSAEWMKRVYDKALVALKATTPQQKSAVYKQIGSAYHQWLQAKSAQPGNKTGPTAGNKPSGGPAPAGGPAPGGPTTGPKPGAGPPAATWTPPPGFKPLSREKVQDVVALGGNSLDRLTRLYARQGNNVKNPAIKDYIGRVHDAIKKVAPAGSRPDAGADTKADDKPADKGGAPGREPPAKGGDAREALAALMHGLPGKARRVQVDELGVPAKASYTKPIALRNIVVSGLSLTADKSGKQGDFKWAIATAPGGLHGNLDAASAFLKRDAGAISSFAKAVESL